MIIWTYDTEFPTIFNKACTYITIKSLVTHRQLSNGDPQGQTCPPGRCNRYLKYHIETFFLCVNIGVQ